MAEKEFEGTTMGGPKSKAEESEVDALIRETLSESAAEKKPKEKKVEAAFAGTPLRAQILKTEAAPPIEPQKKEAPGRAKAVEYEKTFKTYRVGDIVKGKVVKVDPSGIMVDIGYHAEGFIIPDELSAKAFGSTQEVVKVGEEIDVYIEKLESKEGFVVLSKKKAEHEKKWRTAYDAYKMKKVIEGTVTSSVKGGLVVDCNGIRGFIPASQVAKKPETKLESFVGKKLPIKIIEIDRRQGKVVLSHKLGATEKQKWEVDKTIEELEVGEVKKGTVTSLKSFGAFVDIGGVEGLIHLSELSWVRVNHPSELLKVGDEIDVFILGVDKERRKIALGLKQLQPDPWVKAPELYKVGEIIKGKVARLTNFGAFVALEKGLEGLVHISELAKEPVQRPEDAVKIGDEISIKVLRVLPDEQKIGLSIREAIITKEKEEQKEKSKVTIGEVIQEKERKYEDEDEQGEAG